ncbi:MAG: high-affinity iron transporter [Miltoncostaeaceae bacterium]|nr:high-affinity iron transporter [Miltoncostaeaceae bacterium]
MLTALLVMVREGFEAALVVAILWAYLARIGRRDLSRAMWHGVAVASVLAIGGAVVIHLTLERLEGDARMRAFAAVSFAAAAVLTWMVFWMRKQSRAIRGDLERGIDAAIAGGDPRWAVMAVAFLAVLREGLEAALFMVAVATDASGARVAVGASVGLAIAIALGVLVAVGGRRLPMALFFKISGVVLIAFAAGLLSRGVALLQFQGSDDLPTMWGSVYNLTSVHVLTVGSEVGKFLGAMLGWDPRPSLEQVLIWVGYFGLVGALFLRPHRIRRTAPAESAAAATAR